MALGDATSFLSHPGYGATPLLMHQRLIERIRRHEWVTVLDIDKL